MKLHQESNSKRKSSVSIQTDDLSRSSSIFNLNSMSLDEIRLHYQSTLKFLNICHDFMNNVLIGDCPRLDFRVPEVPNYFNCLDMLFNGKNLESCKTAFDFKEMVPNTTISSSEKNFFTDKCGVSPSRLVKSEKDIHTKQKELKALSNTFEEILKTCNEFENKSLEFLLKNDVPLNEPPAFLRDETKREIRENFERGDQKEESPREAFNLLQYSLKQYNHDKSDSDYSPVPSPSQMSRVSIDESRNSSLIILNQVAQSPKKVNEMFKKISRENYEQNRTNSRIRVFDESRAEFSSCESIILTDEEFFKKKSSKPSKNLQIDFSKPETWKSGRLGKFLIFINNGDIKLHLAKVSGDEFMAKANPLKLNDKDKSTTDENVLRRIGLFTGQGEIRPDVISILEEKQRLSCSQNKTKNVKFRSERKFDMEVRFKNVKLSESASDESLLFSGTPSSTCSTISDSDLLNKEL
ncbi:hypothetical protein ABEB36_009012 [Hypothenemus hampei]|uniref:Uncharacterized protein n=1 Tax=Hypothenemus hampei TaxID=57062 RepID=A0ABD1ENU0_HYPHA